MTKTLKQSLKISFAFALGTLIFTGCATTQSKQDHYSSSGTSQQALEEAVSKVKPGLVRIMIVEQSYRSGRETKFVATGSGSIISPDGYVITNHHVAGKAIRIMCTMPNREEIPAILIGTDPATDVCVIKLMPETPQTFPVVKFGNSDAVKVGDPVLALGSPLGLSQSVTNGIISNTEMVIPNGRGGLTLDGANVGELVRWFAHDAQIFGGNSGGPLVNYKGEMIGVNEISFGLAGAIPGNLAKAVAEELIEKGEIQRAFVGFGIQPLMKSQRDVSGVLVSTVFKESPAMMAGFEAGDIITQIESTPVNARYSEDLQAINLKLSNLALDEESPITILRDGKEMVLNIKPTLKPSTLMEEQEIKTWGMTASNLSDLRALSMARDNAQGVLVTSVGSGGPVAKAKPAIKARDIIVQIEGKPVNSLEEFEAINESFNLMEGDELRPTLVEIERDGEKILTVVEVGIEGLDDPGLEVSKAWLPFESQVLTKDLSEKLGKEGTKGVRVTRIYDNAPEDFPFEVGDIITHMDGELINASEEQDVEVFRTMVRAYRLTAEVDFTVIRGDETHNFKSGFLPSPKRGREMERFRDLQFDFILREANFYDRQDPRLGDVEFNVITDSVNDGGWASLGGLRADDIILEIEGMPIDSLADAEAAMDKVHKAKNPYIVFKVRSGVQTRFLEMEPFWEKN